MSTELFNNPVSINSISTCVIQNSQTGAYVSQLQNASRYVRQTENRQELHKYAQKQLAKLKKEVTSFINHPELSQYNKERLGKYL